MLHSAEISRCGDQNSLGGDAAAYGRGANVSRGAALFGEDAAACCGAVTFGGYAAACNSAALLV